jgi:monothiol glutaredoxin
VVHLKAFGTVKIKIGIRPFSANVLENDFIKEEIKKFSQWQTFPQLYINGVFQGGADVVRQMVEDKTWEALLRKHNLIV